MWPYNTENMGLTPGQGINGFPGGSEVKNLPAMQATWVHPWVRKTPWRRKWPPIPIFLPGESQRQRSLASHTVTKTRTRLKRLTTHACRNSDCICRGATKPATEPELSGVPQLERCLHAPTRAHVLQLRPDAAK